MMTTTGRNVELLRTVAAFLREHPERHRQGIWFGTFEDDLLPCDAAAHAEDCDTTGCVAGWGVAFSGLPRESLPVDWWEAGALVYGLDVDTSHWLFHCDRDECTMPDVLDALADGASIEECQAIDWGLK